MNCSRFRRRRGPHRLHALTSNATNASSSAPAENAESAYLVIVNHALLLSDTGEPVDSPGHERLVIDEAHHLEDQVTSRFGVTTPELSIPNRSKRSSARMGRWSPACYPSRRMLIAGADERELNRSAEARDRLQTAQGTKSCPNRVERILFTSSCGLRRHRSPTHRLWTGISCHSSDPPVTRLVGDRGRVRSPQPPADGFRDQLRWSGAVHALHPDNWNAEDHPVSGPRPRNRYRLRY